ncbi:energy-coupling factor transporter transmembrane component T [Falsarthrobacter nasiphocae]|uniref:Energy-coupling factor transporter transmembrane protein EcfT n=1 Tax=Falsarthrobacter nasiphocae TaxID=189863 RepID=A0AAE3YHH9_9MICC|nr:energy-coupling factor transporter transmembrane component T [Falsarthrobacter nasiphocae]MDR6892294.1 energy-coupling factor transporter transmembrane protein EcfT [Falsarthrobacter nasiphocae]
MSTRQSSARAAAPAGGSPRGVPFVVGLNPVAKLLGLIALAVPPTLSMDRLTSLSMLALTVLVIAPLARVSVVGILVRVWPIVVGALGAVWAVAVGAADSGATLLSIGWLTVSEGSLESGVSMLLRSFALALPAIVVMATTDSSELGDGLAQILKMPQRFVLGAVAALRVVGLINDDVQTLRLARRARGVGSFGTPLARWRANAGLTFALLVQVVRRGARMATTMDARGFSATPRTWAYPSVLAPRDWAALGFCVAFAALVWTAATVTGQLDILWA